MKGVRRKSLLAAPSASRSSRVSATPSVRRSVSESRALHELVNHSYPELRRIAAREIRASGLAQTITPSSLVAESVVRLMKQRKPPKNDRHLCGLATILMAQALSDRAKFRRAQKRGKGVRPGVLGGDVVEDMRNPRRDGGSEAGDRSVKELRDSVLEHMARLSTTQPRMMEILALHAVLDVPVPRVAELLGISERTAYRELADGRQRLAKRMGVREKKG